MRNVFIVLLVVLSLANAGMSQSYDHTVARDGSSVIVKTTELNIESSEFRGDSLERMSEVCILRKTCQLNTETGMLKIEEKFGSDHYSFQTEYGLLTITHTLRINSIPSDRFANTFDSILVEADIYEETEKKGEAINLKDSETNSEIAYYLELLDANLSYTIHMPSGIIMAECGNTSAEIDQKIASFNMIEVLKESRPIVVKSSELNFANIFLGSLIVVLVALTLSFLKDKKKKK